MKQYIHLTLGLLLALYSITVMVLIEVENRARGDYFARHLEEYGGQVGKIRIPIRDSAERRAIERGYTDADGEPDISRLTGEDRAFIAAANARRDEAMAFEKLVSLHGGVMHLTALAAIYLLLVVALRRELARGWRALAIGPAVVCGAVFARAIWLKLLFFGVLNGLTS